jgi:hypothetical protein
MRCLKAFGERIAARDPDRLRARHGENLVAEAFVMAAGGRADAPASANDREGAGRGGFRGFGHLARLSKSTYVPYVGEL